MSLCPGAEFGPSKRWPEQHYAAVAQQQIEQGKQVWIFDSTKDVPVAETIRDLLPKALQTECQLLVFNSNSLEFISNKKRPCFRRKISQASYSDEINFLSIIILIRVKIMLGLYNTL